MAESSGHPVDASTGSPDDQPGCSAERADPDPAQPIQVIADTDAIAPGDVDWLSDRLPAAAVALGAEIISFNVVLVDDARMVRMHREYHDDPTTTDVLSFDLRDEVFAGSPEAGVLPAVEGEVYVCIDEAARQAADRGHAVGHELLLYAVHGLLHLVGYDDHDPDDQQRMHEREDELLEAIGVGRVYAEREGRS